MAGFDIAGLESAAYGGKTGDALDRLLFILYEISADQPIAEIGDPKGQFATPQQVLTRIAAAAGAILTNPATEIDARRFVKLCVVGMTLTNVFAQSGFGSSDHVVRAIAGPAIGPDRTLDLADKRLQAPAIAARLLIALSLDSGFEFDITRLLDLPATAALALFMRHVTLKPVRTLRGAARREALVAAHARLKPAPLGSPVDHFTVLGNAFMLTSYASHREKHRAKATLAAVGREWMLARGLKDAALPARRAKPTRPTMAVAAEIMHSNHVQYRYFGQWLRQLRKRFRLALVTDAREVDDHVRALYDEVWTFSRNSDGSYLNNLVGHITALKPDLLFYPSVGMRHWGVALATLRLAPIQCTALGHSASTFCPAIDYYVIEEGYVGDLDCFSEKVVIVPDASTRFERSPHYKPLAPAIRERASPLRVALPSNLLKMNPVFLDTVRRIAGQCGRPLEFHCFPNSKRLDQASASSAIRAFLPNAVVHGVLSYGEYLEKLNACDVNLSPFPFGGLHSVVDSLRQGLPVVAMEGIEPHARTDSMLLRLLGMPEWLIARDVDTYIATALRVIGDDRQRVELSRQALALDIDNRLFGDATTPLLSDIDDAVWWIYQNHEAIQRDPRKGWNVADRARLMAPAGAEA